MENQIDERDERRVAIVTGAAGGIGNAICRQFLSSDIDVVACDVRPAQIELLHAGGATSSALIQRVFDLTDNSAVQQTLDWVASEYGHLDILVNNAAVWFGESFIDSTDAHWREVIDVNVLAPVRLCRLAVPLLSRSTCARIVNVASKNAFLGERGWCSYDVSKAALVALTRGVASELAGLGILVNAVAPGHIATASHTGGGLDLEDGSAGLIRRLPLGRLGEPSEVAQAVAFLASAECSFAAGTTFLMDGGQLAAEDYPA